MQMIGSIAFFVAGVATVTGLSVSLYAALPKAVLAYAEHGRFRGLPGRDRIAGGTRAGRPPEGRLGTAAQSIAARGFAA